MRVLLTIFIIALVDTEFGLGEEVPVDEFLQIYAQHGERLQKFYESSSATVLIDEMRYEVSGVDGNWMVGAFQPGKTDASLEILKCPEGTIHLVNKSGLWTPLGVFPASPRTAPGIGGAEFLDVFCWKALSIKALLEDGWPFTRVIRKDDLYVLYWDYVDSDGVKYSGSRTLDAAHAFVSVKEEGQATDEVASLTVSGESEFRYVDLDASIPILKEIKYSSRQPDGRISEGITKIELRPNEPADPARLTLAHYGISSNVWTANTVPTAPWWESIPGWAIFVSLGIAFFGAAVVARRKTVKV